MRTFAGRGALQGVFRGAADGDTVRVLIDLLWGVAVEKYVRLVNIESWELDGPDRARALAAREWLLKTYARADCTIIPAKWGLDPYGRVLAHVVIGGVDLGDQLVKTGHAWPYRKDPNRQIRGPLTVLPVNNAPGCPRIDPVEGVA